MTWKKFVFYQSIIFIALILVAVYSDPYIGKPFSYVDLIAMFVTVPLYILLVGFNGKLYSRINTSLRNKMFFSIIAFILAFILIVSTDNIWFEVTGKMLFS
ncbi:hypothetical protein [Robertmurraya massiliosenegalensis]|uniref:hypothetical protein n=1 Tax=Robertmurraya massiliosenegalensis TaxID=1287657 RepID=UPI0003782569|nr:hypothetical protein [Robertmurraya massiliosenegalensis]